MRLASPDEEPQADEVGYLLIGQEINIATWVYEGRVAAGAFSDHDWNSQEHMPPAYKKELQIVDRGSPYVRAVELVGPGLSPEIRDRLVEVLLGAHEDPKARRALTAYQKTKQFAELDHEAIANLANLEQMIDRSGVPGDTALSFSGQDPGRSNPPVGHLCFSRWPRRLHRFTSVQSGR